MMKSALFLICGVGCLLAYDGRLPSWLEIVRTDIERHGATSYPVIVVGFITLLALMQSIFSLTKSQTDVLRAKPRRD